MLDLQALDTRLDTLTSRRERLPELAELETLVAEHRGLGGAVTGTRTEVEELTAAQESADREVAAVRAKRDRDQQRLDAGQVGSAKELQALASEVESLHRRQDELEEAELEVMERLEEAQSRLDDLTHRQAELAQRGVAVRTARDAAWVTIDAESETARADRERVAAGVPDGLRELYEKLRPQLGGGLVAVPLERRSCGGCRIEIAPTDLAKLRSSPPDAVLRCAECGRIMVRTAESQL